MQRFLTHRERTKLDYRDKQRLLKELGRPHSFDLRAKLTPARKAAITRRWKDYAGFFNEENSMELVPASKSELRKLRETYPRSQLTEKGVIIQKPPGAKVKVKDGRVIIRKGKLRQETFAFDRVEMAKDPQAAFDKLNRMTEGQQKSYFITYKGFRAHERRRSVKDFLWYLEHKLIPDIEDEPSRERYFGITVLSVIKNRRKTHK